MKRTFTGRKKRRILRPLVIVPVAVLLAAAVSLWYVRHQPDKAVSTASNRRQNQTSSSDVVQGPEFPDTVVKNPTPTPNPNVPAGSTSGQPNVIVSAPVITIGNHSPSLNPSDPRNQENSTCTTTVGAGCIISFTKDGATKSLPAKTTDGNGSANWTWTPQSIGLTQGSWTITATATLSGQTKTGQDSLPLTVQP